MAVEPVVKTIQIKPARPVKKRNRVKTIFRQFIFLLILSVIAAIAIKYYILPKFHREQAPVVTQEISPTISEPVVEEIKPTPQETTVAIEPVPPSAAEESMGVEIKTINQRLDGLTVQNKSLLTYFAARDLKESLNDNESFHTQLEFLSDAAGDDANLNGKIDILMQATATGLVTKEKLLADLKLLQKSMARTSDDTFSGSIKGALGNLVKVSKIEGDISATDYNSILKRAELVLSKDKISAAELQNVINETAKLGKPAENFVREANNLERVLEVTDFLVTYTKAKAIEANSADD